MTAMTITVYLWECVYESSMLKRTLTLLNGESSNENDNGTDNHTDNRTNNDMAITIFQG